MSDTGQETWTAVTVFHKIIKATRVHNKASDQLD